MRSTNPATSRTRPRGITAAMSRSSAGSWKDVPGVAGKRDAVAGELLARRCAGLRVRAQESRAGCRSAQPAWRPLTAIPASPAHPSPIACAGLPMPHVELIDMKQERRFRKGIHLLSQRLEHLLRTTLDAGHQAILLLNRRGYSNFVLLLLVPGTAAVQILRHDDDLPPLGRRACCTARRSTKGCTPGSCIATIAWRSIRCRTRARRAGRS